MLSSSRNYLRPAFTGRSPDRSDHSFTSEGSQVSITETRLWSFQEPPLTIGNYHLSVSQDVQLPADRNTRQAPAPKTLLIPDTALSVQGPRFRFSDPADIHSVSPAPGHQAYARTLAHAVLTHPTLPWERDITGNEADVGSNKQPWLAILSFTEEELLLNTNAYRRLGFDHKNDVVSGHGSVATKAGRLDVVKEKVKSTLTAVGANPDFQPDDDVSILLLQPAMFKSIFSKYDEKSGTSSWSGTADVSLFAMMAHTHESDGGFMASSYHQEDGQLPRQFSTIVSPRTAPPDISQPTRVISHIVSLEDVDRVVLAADDSDTGFVGLVSLHAWEWMGIPEDGVDFETVMVQLGKSAGPLKGVHTLPLPSPSMPGKEMSPDPVPSSEEMSWINSKLETGHILRTATALSGEKTTVLIRGPLIPVRASSSAIVPFSLCGEDLELVDTETGFIDVTYTSAWSLGRSCVMSDRTLSTSLLRLRGSIHKEAVRRCKKKKIQENGIELLSSSKDFLSSLPGTIGALETAHQVSGISLTRPAAAARWTRSRKERENLPIMHLSKDSSKFSLTEYLDQIHQVTLAKFGFKSQDENGKIVPATTIDSDAAAVRAWTLDCFFLAGIPLHSLVLDPTMLPKETIRSFCVDERWIDALVDGGLSLANHFARDDDAIRRAIKLCINQYLATPLHVSQEGSTAESSTTPQLPRWGFLMRSAAVSAFPDLKVEAPLPPDAPPNTREVLFMQVLCEDVLICLFDRIPGEQGFDYVRISQPPHQQGFEFGTKLTRDAVHGSHRGVPTERGSDVNVRVAFEKAPGDRPQVYDPESRVLQPNAYMSYYFNDMKNQKSGDIFMWPEQKWTAPPASLLATQLRTKNLRLTMRFGDKKSGKGGPDVPLNQDRWKSAAARLSISRRPDQNPAPPSHDSPNSSQPQPQRAPPANAALPKGPRRDVTLSEFMQFDPQLEVEEEGKPKDNIETLPRDRLDYQPLPQQADVFWVNRPESTSNTIYATEYRNNDIVIALRGSESDGLPKMVEVRIPVSLEMGGYPSDVKDSSPAWLSLEGASSCPELPLLEDLTTAHHWSYSCRLAVGSLYALVPEGYPEPGDSIPPRSERCMILVITIEPRFDPAKLSIRANFFEATLALRRVRAITPKASTPGEHQTPSATTTQIDIVWHKQKALPDRRPERSIRTQQLIIRPAILARIPHCMTEFSDSVTKLDMTVGLSHRPEAGAKLMVRGANLPHGLKRSSHFKMLAPLTSPVPQDSSPDNFLFHASLDLGRNAPPRWITIGVVSRTEEPLGPESGPVYNGTMRALDDYRDICYRWDNGDLIASWKHNAVTQMPYRLVIKALTSTQTLMLTTVLTEAEAEREIATAPSALLGPLVSPQGTVTLQVFATNNSGQPQGSVTVDMGSLQKLPAFPQPMSITDGRQNKSSGEPAPASQLCSARWRGSWPPMEDPVLKTEFWYWDSAGQVSGLGCAREAQAAYLVDSWTPEPSIPEWAPSCVPAGAIGMFRDDQTGRPFIVWVGSDGSINCMNRQSDSEKAWQGFTQIAPPQSASVLGQGTLAVCGDLQSLAEPLGSSHGGHHNAVVWWVGKRGEITGRRCEHNTDTGSGTFQWTALDPAANLPDGSVDVSASLPRPAQIATIWSYDGVDTDDAYLMWIRSNGDLMVSRAAGGSKLPSQSGIAVRNADAAPGASMVAYIGSRSPDPSITVNWVCSDGSVAMATSPQVSTIFKEPWVRLRKVASAEAANPLADLCILGDPNAKARAIVWASPKGQVQIATKFWDEQEPECAPWSWSSLPQILGGNQLFPTIAKAGTGEKGIVDVFYWSATGWSTFAVDCSLISK